MTVWSIQPLIDYSYCILLFSQNKSCQNNMEVFYSFLTAVYIYIYKVISQYFCERKNIFPILQKIRETRRQLIKRFSQGYIQLGLTDITFMKKTKTATTGNPLHSTHSWSTLPALATLPTIYSQLKGKFRFLFLNAHTVQTFCLHFMSGAVQHLFAPCFTAP